MLISHSHRFIFIHIYKVAGVSIRTALQPYAAQPRSNVRELYERWRGRATTPRLDTHAMAREVRAALPAKLFDGYFKFAFVRNPWDWQVSLYHFMRRSPLHPQHALVCAMQDFDEYLAWRVQHEVRLQKDFLTDGNGRVLVDHVGRFETIGQDFDHICKMLNLAAPLPHENKTDHADFRAHYNERTRALVAESFREDIEMFGYSFD
ncbi:MAG: sulfotransferase family 2 domain-containing protein [Planctomycetia bacterium]|nr:sulfotransferase family 2 domain-containing protein [Planctomycetia bacterium]